MLMPRIYGSIRVAGETNVIAARADLPVAIEAVEGGAARITPGDRVICRRKSWRSIKRVIMGDSSISDLPRTELHSWYAVAVSVRTCASATAMLAWSLPKAATVACNWASETT